MALEGNLKDFGLADILQLIYFQRKTGILSLRGKLDSVRIVFLEGNIAGASSKRREEGARIGRMLVQRGLLTEPDLQKALEISKRSAERLGRTLFEMGKVPLESLLGVLAEQMTQTVVQVFSWKEGNYEFVAQEITVDSKVSVSLDTEHLLMEGLRVTDEWSYYEGKVNLNAIYERTERPPEDLDRTEASVYAQVDGHSDVNAIMDITMLNQVEVARGVVSLMDKGCIRELRVKEVVHETAPVRRRAKISESSAFTLMGAGLVLVMVIWTLVQAMGISPYLERFDQGVTLEFLRLKAETYAVRTGEYPQTLDDFAALPPTLSQNVYRYEPFAGRPGFRLTAAGLDGVLGSDDDIR